MKELKIETKRGTLLDGVLFQAQSEADTVKNSGIAASRGSDTVLICITGIHGNFYSNPFYYNIGDTLTAAGIDFIYAQTNDAFGAIRTHRTRILDGRRLSGRGTNGLRWPMRTLPPIWIMPKSRVISISFWLVTRWVPTR